MAARSVGVAGRAVSELAVAAVAAIVISLAYGTRERERIAQQSDGTEVETDGDSIIAAVSYTHLTLPTNREV